MWYSKTGLKWDPVSIVDLLALFHGSNVLSDFEDLEFEPGRTASDLLSDKHYRLGYWEKGVDREIWYGIGRRHLGAATPGVKPNTPLSLRSAASTAHPIGLPNLPIMNEEDINGIQGSLPSLISSATECHGGRHRKFCGHDLGYNRDQYPWHQNPYFAPWTVLFWTPFVLGCLALCIYVSASGAVKRGFNIPTHAFSTNSSLPRNPYTFNLTSTGGDIIITNFDPGNGILWALFIFRTLLVILSSYLALTWLGWVDESVRFSQPFANMYNKVASAEDSILLDYLWGMPGLTTIKAFNAGHYKVAWYSLLNLISPAFPVLVSGLFIITNTGIRIYFKITPLTFYAVSAYFILYAVSVPFAWPGRSRRLMRYHDSIADYVSLFYASYLLHDPESKLDISRSSDTKRHLESRVFLEEKKYRVGIYNGVDGRPHFGLDVAYIDNVQHVLPWA